MAYIIYTNIPNMYKISDGNYAFFLRLYVVNDSVNRNNSLNIGIHVK